ncbi:MAG: hypothetical protein QXF82_08325 [Nitrososphaeria archaeon]
MKNYNISRLRENYRRIWRSLQKKVEKIYERNRLLKKYGARERSRVEDRVKKVAMILAEITRAYDVDIVRENLKNMIGSKFKCKRCGFELNSHYVACLNLFSHLNDSRATIRGGRIYLSPEVGLVVATDVAPMTL